MARPYRSRAPLSAASLLALGCAGLGCALVLAATWHLTGALGQLVVAGVVVRGLVIGVVLMGVVKRMRIARPAVVASVATLATLLAVGGAHYRDHLVRRAEALEDAEELRSLSISAGSEPFVADAAYRDREAALSFLHYWREFFGLEGDAIDSASRSMGPSGGMLLFTFELVAGVFAALYYPMGIASEPACPRCGEWREEQALGRAAFGATRTFLRELLAGNASASDVLAAPDTPECLDLVMARCPRGHDEEGGALRVRERVFDRHSRVLMGRHRADIELSAAEAQRIGERVGAWA